MELDKESFEAVMARVDSQLAAANTGIPGRPLQAMIAIFNEFGVSGPIAHPFPKSLGFPVTAANLSDHVNVWYGEKYKDLLKIDPSPGRFPVLIEGAVYPCRLPLAIGKFMVLGGKGRFKDKRILNAVEFVENLPEHVRERLTGETENLLQVMFITCMEVTKELRPSRASFLVSAKSDILVSCDLSCGYHVNASLSAWHALQFAEKILKEYISRSEVPSRSHNIEALREKAATLGYVPDGRIDWEVFGFTASVRYDPTAIDLPTAVRVNHEAWRVGYNVLKQMN